MNNEQGITNVEVATRSLFNIPCSIFIIQKSQLKMTPYEFSKRMFTYFYRIFDKYQREITAIAIFTDKDPNYKPEKFEYSFWGTELTYKYRTYKVLEQKEEKLIKSSNAFALVILAMLYAIKTTSKSKIDERYLFKINLTKLLLERGYFPEKIDKIFFFIDNIMKLPDNIELKFNKKISETLGGEKSMPTIERHPLLKIVKKRIERIAKEKWLREGLEKGMEKGEKIGVRKVAQNLLKLGNEYSYYC